MFFDHVLDAKGTQSWQTRIWQTRVYHDETDAEVQFPGVEPHQWVQWILQQADLPAELRAVLPAAPLASLANAPAHTPGPESE